MRDLTTEEKVQSASAVFNAQNSLSLAWNAINTGSPEAKVLQRELHEAQVCLRRTVELLGGVEFLIDNGA